MDQWSVRKIEKDKTLEKAVWGKNFKSWILDMLMEGGPLNKYLSGEIKLWYESGVQERLSVET